MPDLDGGHLFLTALMPVRLGEVALADGRVTTPSHLLRETLASLPTARQSPVTAEQPATSPFARCRRTHFLRLLVIDQPMYNGRDPTDPLRNILPWGRRDPLVHQPFDSLSCPWLLLAADIDRTADLDGGAAAWAEGLWTRSEAQMRAIFGHCHGFEAVADAAGFAAYLARGRVETTMSFNDYWPGRPPLKGETLTSLALKAGSAAVAAGLLLWLLFGPERWWGWALLLLAAAGAAIGSAIALLWTRGRRPYPPAPDSDLPSILKALHVQQRFAFLVETAQGLDAAALHRSFGAFLAQVRPSDPEAPTQPPGVIRSDGVSLVRPELVDDRTGLPL